MDFGARDVSSRCIRDTSEDRASSVLPKNRKRKRAEKRETTKHTKPSKTWVYFITRRISEMPRAESRDFVACPLLSRPRQQEDQRRVPIDRHFIRRVRLLIVEEHLRRREIGRHLPHRRILTSTIRTARQQSRPRLLIRVRPARAMVRVQERIPADLRHKRQRKRIPPQQVMEILQ